MALTLRRIAGGARLVGLAWMLVLILVALARGDLLRPQSAWLLVAATVVWGVVVALDQVHPREQDPWWVNLADTVLASWALLAPEWVGSRHLIYGGYPAITVAAAAASTRKRGRMVAAVLSLVTLVRLRVEGWDGLLGSLSQLITYGMIAGIVGWAVHVIVVADRRRRAAEEGQARAEERSRVAAHLHDSVLQTLALIQRQPEDPVRVAALARRQERELRDWLYGPADTVTAGLAEALRAAAAEVDTLYGARIEVVSVGDAPMTDSTKALVAAAREAMVNAAKHSGAETSVYLESGADRARVFVRDRGKGFEPELVPPDRHGIRLSIKDRIEQVGGVAVIDSKPGKGTEVRLEVPL